MCDVEKEGREREERERRRDRLEEKGNEKTKLFGLGEMIVREKPSPGEMD
jgi:hypothetical protein